MFQTWWLNPQLWIEISWGFFLLGIIFVIIAVFSAAEHGADHDFDHDIDHEIDVSHDFDHDIDHDMDMGHDIDIGGDIEGHIGYAETPHGAPLTLLMGTFFLTYGGSGLAIFTMSQNVLLNIISMIFIAFVALFTVNFFFKSFFKTGTYYWRPEMAIGRRAVVVFEVNANHGTVKVDTGTPLGIVKYPARSADPNKTFRPGQSVYIIDWREGIAVVDDSPRR